MRTYHSSARVAALAVLTTAVLSACGGGGSDAPPADPFAAPVVQNLVLPPLALTPDNAVDAAGAASFVSTTGISSSAGEGPSTAAPVPSKASQPGAVAMTLQTNRKAFGFLARKTHGALQVLRSKGSAAPGVRITASAADALACTDGGSFRFVDPSGGPVRLNSRLGIVFDQCAEGGVVTDGFVSITVTGIDGDIDTGIMHASVASDVSITTGDRVSVRFGGSLTDVSDHTQAGISVDTLDGNMLIQEQVDGQMLFAQQSTDAHVVERDFDADGHSELSVDYTLSGTFAGIGDGSLHVATSQPLVLLGDDQNPSAGVMRLTGANGSTVDLVVNDATSVTLTVDPHDGTGTTVIDASWDDLRRKLQLAA